MTTKRRRTLPAVSAKADQNTRQLLTALAEIVETGEGVRGNPLDRKLTFRDLLDSGIGELVGNRVGDGRLRPGGQIRNPSASMAVPPKPEGFAASGGFYGMNSLSWTVPSTLYANHAQTRIYRSEEDNFANAVVIGMEAGAFYTDIVRSDALDPDDPTKLKGYFYWVAFVSTANIEGPPNDSAGTYAAPIADVGYVMELLTDRIDKGLLAQSLREEIEQIERIPALETAVERIAPIETAVERIPALENAVEVIPALERELRGPESLHGTIANRFAKEREARLTALEGEREAWGAAIEDESERRASALEAAAQDRRSLTSRIGDNAADIQSTGEAVSRTNEALAETASEIWAGVDDNAALVREEQRARSAENDYQARVQRVLEARNRFATATTYSLEEVRLRDQEATATRVDGIALSVGETRTLLEEEVNLSASRDQAQGERITSMQSNLEGDLATVRDETRSEVSRVEGKVEANAERSEETQAALGERIAGVADDTRANASETALEAARSRVMSARTRFGTATAYSLEEVRLEKERATAQRIDGILLEVDGARAALEDEVQLSAERDRSQGERLSTMQSQIADDLATVRDESATEVSRLDGRVTTNASRIGEVQSALGDDLATVRSESRAGISRLEGEVSSNASQIDTVQSSLSGDLAVFQQETRTGISDLDDEISNTGKRVSTLQSQFVDDLATVRDDAETEIKRVDGRVSSNASRIGEVQSALDDDIASVRSEALTEISRVDGAVDATAQLVQEVQTDIGAGLNAVEIKAITNAGGILSNGQFGTGDLSGWGDTWSGISVVEADTGAGAGAIRGAPTRFVAAWQDSGWGSNQYMRGDRFAAIAGETYTLRFSYASGGNDRNIDVEIRVAWVAANGSVSYDTIHHQNVSYTSWEKTPVLKRTAPDDTVEAWVYFRRNSGGRGTLYIADVQASRTDMLAGSLYTAKLQSNGLIGGFGVYNDGSTVEAGFDVDRFWVGRTNDEKRKPFIIEDGETYLDEVMIRKGSIQQGQLGPINIGETFLPDGTPVTTAAGLIRAEGIDVDSLRVPVAATFDGIVRSGNYRSGNRGFRIDATTGDVEFNGGVFRGKVSFRSVEEIGNVARWNTVGLNDINGGRLDKGTIGDDVGVDGGDKGNFRELRDRAYQGLKAGERVNGWTRPNSTLIWGNQIYTGDAYVDTLQLKGQAVTISSTTSAGSKIAFTAANGEVTLLIHEADDKGADAILMASFGSMGGGIAYVKIYRDDELVAQRACGNVAGAFCLAIGIGASGSGVRRYKMTAISSSNTIGDASNVYGRSISSMIAQR
ncbi:phage tail tip fiber protein [Salinicola halophilus]|uniref:phage tail tip fiber protein n=1 Tax=Salinicola halophilus TaxID=184065 RepID=UPI000DA23366|nr:hypothetical protein [Salinicola halophilus]